MSARVRRLDAATRADFDRVHCEANGLGWCRCVAWWVPTWDEFRQRTADRNAAHRNALFDRGEWDVYAVYEGGEPVGTCQCGERDRLPKLAAAFGLDPAPGVFALSCLALAPAHRGRGLARRLVAGVLDDLRVRGVARVEAYPRTGEGHGPGEVWTGPERLFRSLGFALVRPGEPRAVYALDL